MADPFFDELREWSRYKLLILDKYLHVFAYKLSSRSAEMAFVDAFAGAGVYGEGEPGSPVIAAKWNDEAVLRSKGARIIVHACEPRPASAASLREALRPWADQAPPRAYVYEARFENVLPEILERTRRVPTFFFIDPYGLRALAGERLRPLLQDRRRDRTEVLVRADPILLARFAGWLRGAGDERRQRTAARFRQLLSDLNIDVDALATEAEGYRPAPHAMALFGEYLRLFRDRFAYVQIIPIRAHYFAAPKYYLIHGTDNPHGAAKLNDVLSTTEDQLFASSVLQNAGNQMSLFEPRREPRVGIADAERYVIELLGMRGTLRFVEVCARLALKFGPDLREKHHKRAVRNLVRNRQVRAVPTLSEESLAEETLLSIAL